MGPRLETRGHALQFIRNMSSYFIFYFHPGTCVFSSLKLLHSCLGLFACFLLHVLSNSIWKFCLWYEPLNVSRRILEVALNHLIRVGFALSEPHFLLSHLLCLPAALDGSIRTFIQ